MFKVLIHFCDSDYNYWNIRDSLYQNDKLPLMVFHSRVKTAKTFSKCQFPRSKGHRQLERLKNLQNLITLESQIVFRDFSNSILN